MKEYVKAKRKLESLNKKCWNLDKKRPTFFKDYLRVESKYYHIWKKYNQNKNQNKREFLKISIRYAELFSEYSRWHIQFVKSILPYRDKQEKLIQKIRKLEKKHESSNKFFQEKKKIRDEIEVIAEALRTGIKKFRKANHQMHLAKRKYLRVWKKYSQNLESEKEFIKCSNVFAKLSQKARIEEANYLKWKNSRYQNRIIEITKKSCTLEAQLE